jgi:hypothetical protein
MRGWSKRASKRDAAGASASRTWNSASPSALLNPPRSAPAHYVQTCLSGHKVIDRRIVKDGLRDGDHPCLAGAEDGDEPNVWICTKWTSQSGTALRLRFD